MIETMADFADYLAEAQSARRMNIACEFAPELSARVNDAALREAVLTGLPMAQGVELRICRSRGRGAVLTAKLQYREGVRMLDAACGQNTVLLPKESSALEAAQTVAAEALRRENDEARFQHVFDWLCRNVRYVHTKPGLKGYERLVGAAGALHHGEANCQGFADALYLLCGLCGIPAVCRCGPGERQLHVWNEVCIGGTWRIADASKGARGMKD